MRKVAPGVQKSLYPLCYNKNNPMEGYNRWMEYIHQQNVINSMGETTCIILVAIDRSKLIEVKDVKAMNGLLEEANYIINK